MCETVAYNLTVLERIGNTTNGITLMLTTFEQCDRMRVEAGLQRRNGCLLGMLASNNKTRRLAAIFYDLQSTLWLGTS